MSKKSFIAKYEIGFIDMNDRKYKNFSEFYPFYLSEHSDLVNRRLHFLGSLLAIVVVILTIATQEWLLLLLVPFVGYGCAWIGHYFVERNKPATFSYPVYSFIGDWVMFRDIIIGKIKL